jgi:hypothetical protein
MRYDGTLTKSTERTLPPAVCTRAVTRPDGTSTTTSVVPSAGAGTRPERTAQAPSAMVPWPQAVENPSLCQNSTPRCAPASSGGTRNPPYMSACPRGSKHSSRRSPSTAGSPIANTRRSATVAPRMSTGGSGTMRNGSPPV